MVGIDILVVAEHDGVHLHPATRQMVSAAVELAFLSNGDVHVLVADPHSGGVVEAAAEISGVMKILCADYFSKLDAVQLALSRNPSRYCHVLVPGDPASSNFAQQLMSTLQAEAVSDVAKVLALNVFDKHERGGTVTVVSESDPIVLFVDVAAFKSATLFGHASIELLAAEEVCPAAKDF